MRAKSKYKMVKMRRVTALVTNTSILTKEEPEMIKQSQMTHPPQRKIAKLHPLKLIQKRKKICPLGVSYVILLAIVDKDIYVKRTWVTDYFQTYLTPFIEYGKCNSNNPL